MRKFYSSLGLRHLLVLPFLMLTTGVFGQFYHFDSLSPGDVGTLSNGWVGAPASGYSWRADNNGTGSSGTGPDVDHTQGNAAGIYMYTEASSPATQGDTATLESPNLVLSSFTNPGLSFWFHKAGTSMGDLYIDIFDGTNWINGVDSIIGSVQMATSDPWLRRTVDLSSYPDTIKVRFTAIMGTSFSGDMAIDDVSLFELPAFDLELSNTVISPSQYYMYPEIQANGIAFSGELANVGASALTNPTMRVTVGAWVDSASVATLAAGASATVTTNNLTPQPVGFYTASFDAFAVENDTNLTNNLDSLNFYLTDSVYARDDSNATGSLGIGAGTPGILGQNFDIYTTDTLTSVSFFLNGPTIGDTAWVSIHSFTTAPGAEIARTNDFIIPADTPAWYTLTFPCAVELTPGTYFVGMNETDENITLGTTPFNFQDNAGWVIFGANQWQPSEFYGFSVTYLLRANFGPTPPATANAGLAGSDSTCSNSGMTDLFAALGGTPDVGGVWSDNNATGALSGSMVDPQVAGAGMYTFTYTVTDSCGGMDSSMVTLTIASGPFAGVDSMFAVCDFDGPVDLATFIAPSDTTGTWSDDNNTGALSGSVFTPNGVGAGTYNFTYVIGTAQCGNDSATVSITVNVCPAIDPAVELSFEIFPNPNQGQFKINVPSAVGQNLEVRVLDLMGKEVYAAAVDNASSTLEIDLEDVVAGVYIVELNNGETRTQGRLIKE